MQFSFSATFALVACLAAATTTLAHYNHHHHHHHVPAYGHHHHHGHGGHGYGHGYGHGHGYGRVHRFYRRSLPTETATPAGSAAPRLERRGRHSRSRHGRRHRASSSGSRPRQHHGDTHHLQRRGWHYPDYHRSYSSSRMGRGDFHHGGYRYGHGWLQRRAVSAEPDSAAHRLERRSPHGHHHQHLNPYHRHDHGHLRHTGFNHAHNVHFLQRRQWGGAWPQQNVAGHFAGDADDQFHDNMARAGRLPGHAPNDLDDRIKHPTPMNGGMATPLWGGGWNRRFAIGGHREGWNNGWNNNNYDDDDSHHHHHHHGHYEAGGAGDAAENDAARPEQPAARPARPAKGNANNAAPKARLERRDVHGGWGYDNDWSNGGWDMHNGGGMHNGGWNGGMHGGGWNGGMHGGWSGSMPHAHLGQFGAFYEDGSSKDAAAAAAQVESAGAKVGGGSSKGARRLERRDPHHGHHHGHHGGLYYPGHHGHHGLPLGHDHIITTRRVIHHHA